MPCINTPLHKDRNWEHLKEMVAIAKYKYIVFKIYSIKNSK